MTLGPGVASGVAIDVESEAADIAGHGLNSKGEGNPLAVFIVTLSMPSFPDP